MESLIAQERKKYHESLLREGVLTIDKNGIPSNADKSSKISVSIALGIANRLMAETHDKSVGQTSGAKFEQLNMEFLSSTFPKLQNLRPGTWHITKLGNRNSMKTSSFAQYEHLDYLNRLTAYDRKLAASMGNDYMVAPDVVVYRDTVSDEDINEAQVFVDDSVCTMADLRKKNGGLPILHASVSAKFKFLLQKFLRMLADTLLTWYNIPVLNHDKEEKDVRTTRRANRASGLFVLSRCQKRTSNMCCFGAYRMCRMQIL